jgi:MoxR-like ATPase
VIDDGDADRFQEIFHRLEEAVATRVFGKEDPIRLAVTCLLAGGHLLIEDVPGVAKTLMARSLAEALGGHYRRVQFTPDLLPADVTGGLVYNQKDGTLKVHRGPVFTHVLLADEINRAAPRTQSALLEAMAEKQVTLGGETYRLPDPFLCIATQNPGDMSGTYQLPEAQIDRFTVRLKIDYPSPAVEARAIEQQSGTAGAAAPTVTSPAEVQRLIQVARDVHLDPGLARYVADLAALSRTGRHEIELGVSPRGSIALAACAKVWALAHGLRHVLPRHIQALAVPVLAHRLVMTSSDGIDRERAESAVRSLLEELPTPDRAPLVSVDG